VLDGPLNTFVLIHHVFDSLAGVNDRAVIATTKVVSDFL
jgi:hypothetical protein